MYCGEFIEYFIFSFFNSAESENFPLISGNLSSLCTQREVNEHRDETSDIGQETLGCGNYYLTLKKNIKCPSYNF